MHRNALKKLVSTYAGDPTRCQGGPKRIVFVPWSTWELLEYPLAVRNVY